MKLRPEISPCGIFPSVEMPLSQDIEDIISRASECLSHAGFDGSLAFLIRELLILPGSTAMDDLSKKALYFLLFVECFERQMGSSYVPVDLDFFRKKSETFIPSEQRKNIVFKAYELCEQGLEGYISLSDANLPLVVEEGCLFAWKIRELEKKLAEELQRRLELPRLGSDIQIAGGPLQLSEEQSQAVKIALNSTFTVIMGGPGTGKTSIVQSIISSLEANGEEAKNIALAAPTGKAAKRLGEAMTLHRLLGYRSGSKRFDWHKNHRLPYSTVIVDEVSMIDSYMMYRLLIALKDSCRLILLGDSEQLPSIDLGSFLKDMVLLSKCEEFSSTCVFLNKNYRLNEQDKAAAHVINVAQAVTRQDHNFLESSDGLLMCSSHQDLEWNALSFCELSDSYSLNTFLDFWYQQRVKSCDNYDNLITRIYRYDENGFVEDDKKCLDKLFDHLSSHKLLCLPHVGFRGSRFINSLLQQKRRQDLKHGSDEYLPGDPVIYLKNDYSKGLFNGESGVVVAMRSLDNDVSLRVVFENSSGEYVVWPLIICKFDIELSYALTVHKSQGSEFAHVGIILPEFNIPLATKEILYTAITRSKKSVTIVGGKRVFFDAVSRTISRRSKTLDRIKRSLNES